MVIFHSFLLGLDGIHRYINGENHYELADITPFFHYGEIYPLTVVHRFLYVYQRVAPMVAQSSTQLGDLCGFLSS